MILEPAVCVSTSDGLSKINLMDINEALCSSCVLKPRKFKLDMRKNDDFMR